MKTGIRLAATITLLWGSFSVAGPGTGVPEAFPEPAVEGDEQAFEQELRRAELRKELGNELPRLGDRQLITVMLSKEELEQISETPRSGAAGDSALPSDEDRFQPSKPVLVGLAKTVDLFVDLSDQVPADLLKGPSEVAGGLLQYQDSGILTWSTVIYSPGANALRLRLADFDLPPGAELLLYNSHGDVTGPYTGNGPDGNGDFWTHTVNGDRVQVVLRFESLPFVDDLQASSFRIAEISHLGPLFQVPDYAPGEAAISPFDQPRRLCGYNAPCVEDASCYGTAKWSQIDSARKAIAHITYQKDGGSYICTGGLIADTDSATQIPLFLTAHHCIGSNQEAQTVEAFWRYQTPSCGAACFSAQGNVPSTRGATLLSASPNTDYALMRLNQAPPAGSWYLGWTAAELHNSQGTRLYRLSHPKGAPLAYSEHAVDTAAGTCPNWPRGNFIYSSDVIGATQGGSSGSPVTNVQGQIVGQLTGGCGPQSELSDNCSSLVATVDGAFARTFPNIRQWLQPSGGTALPAAPSNLAATASAASEINLTWRDNANNESGFRVERKTGAAGNWAEVAVLGANTTSYRDRGLNASTRFYYRVRSYNGQGNSSYSNEANALTTASADCIGNISLGQTIKGVWSQSCASTHRSGSYARFYRFTLSTRSTVTIDLSGTEDTFAFLLNGSGSGGAIASQNDDGGVNTNSRISTTLNAGNYTIEATTYLPNRTGSFDLSLQGTGAAAPIAPSQLTTNPITPTRINLNWSDNSNNETGFRIERKTGANGSWAQVGTSGANAPRFWDSGLAPSTTYFYRVYAYNGTGSSSPSNEASGTTPSQTSCSSGLSVNQTAAGNWDTNCRSTHRAGSYAKFFSFTLNANTQLTIDLTSAEDSFLYLLGGGANGSVIASNDDGGAGRNARISRQLGAGSYTIEATTYSSGVTGSFNLSLQTSQKPAAPSNLNAGAASTTAINLTWQDNAINEKGTRIERKTGVNGAWALLTHKAANVTSHSDTGLSSGTTYFYRALTFNDSGVSAWSNEASATTGSTTSACVGRIAVGQTVNGSWGPGCQSTSRPGSYARYYTFTLNAPTNLVALLSSNEDSYMYVRSGGAGGPIIAEDDDGGGNLDAMLFGQLGAGTYTIEATTFFGNVTGQFTLTLVNY